MTSDMNLETARRFIEQGGFHDFLKMSLVSHDQGSGELVVRLPYRDAYARMPERGDYHGGVIASVLDVVGTFTAALRAGKLVATSNLRTDYLHNPVRSELIVSGAIIRAGRSQVTVDVAARDADGRLCAVARGGWTVLG